MYEDLKDLKDQAADIAQQRRQLEADAYAIMRERPMFFALKLIFGIGHNAPQTDEEEPEIQDGPKPVAVH